ncbi:MAG: DUF839 domain-containing protein [Flavobacteriales bacterium]|nr:DUF839 domain-containing protein [Flavobacteriales bacterium]
MKISAAILSLIFPLVVFGQDISTFTSVNQGSQDHFLRLPSTHTFQLLAKSLSTITGTNTLKPNCDFTAYIPIDGSSEKGYLSVNHEIAPVGGVSIFQVQINPFSKYWEIDFIDTVSFSDVVGTRKNCSGGIIPWHTIFTSEEFPDSSDTNLDGYIDNGWLIELDPATQQIVDQDGDGLGDKLWALGRGSHENAVIANDSVVYYGFDHPSRGFVLKFVCNQPRDFTAGKLYAIQLDSITAGHGKWIQIPNNTIAEQNTTNWAAFYAGATNFNGVEDVEIGPDNNIYFSAKSTGRIYRFSDQLDSIPFFEIYVENQVYTMDSESGTQNVSWGIGADNLAFDNQGNLWVCQDGDSNYIWVVDVTHSPSSPNISLFAVTPKQSEPTGINFTPDGKFLFMSLQHPTWRNTSSQLDATGSSIKFNESAVIVIGRKEDFGRHLNAPGLNVFPNPTNNKIWFEYNADTGQEVIVSIVNDDGRIVFKEQQLHTAGYNLIQVDVSTLAVGTYVFSVSRENGALRSKFIKTE